jgi:flagellin
MAIVLHTNSTARNASNHLLRATHSLAKSLSKLSSGRRISTPADDAGGLSFGYKVHSTLSRNNQIRQNLGNATSFLQVQEGALGMVGKIINRMTVLKTMYADSTKSAGDLENYDKEF